MIYEARKDKTYFLVIWSGPVVFTIASVITMELIVALIAIIFYLLAFSIWNGTIYKIESGILNIKCWILSKKIKVADIRSVKKVTNIFSSYSLSAKRFELKYKNGSIVYIAPKDEERFKEELKQINDRIIFK